MNYDDKKITPKKQAHPDELRTLFLHGVMDQAHIEGYAVRDKGKLLVAALRIWEDR